MSNGRLRWGVVGCGDVVEKKSGPSIFAAGRSDIVAVMRRDVEKARFFALTNGIGLSTDDAQTVIERSEVDIVYVATPPVHHARYVIQAAEAGKHVLVEKPMGMNAAEDRRMIEACEAASVQLFVAYYRRFQPHVLKMKELIEKGVIGRLVMGQIDFGQPEAKGYDAGWRVQPEISGGGLYMDVVSHRIDAMIWLMGCRPVKAAGVKGKFDEASKVEQAAVVSVGFENEAVLSAAGDFASRRFADRFVITGSKGSIISERLDSHGFRLEVDGEDTKVFEFKPLVGPHLGLVEHIEEVLLDGKENLCSGRDGMLTDWVLDEGLRGGS